MSKKKEEIRIPKCSVQTVKGKKYYRIQMKDEEGKNTSVSAKTEEEARAKYLKNTRRSRTQSFGS